MNENSFTEKDKEEFVKFLNYVATNAKFEMKTQDALTYVQSLQYMQKTILKKIDGHILEVKRVIENKEAE
jgi:hypothetical protein